MTRQPTMHDVYVGQRIREARNAENMTQTDLSEYIGVSYQQLQKYETGINRVPGARLELLVTVLRKPLTYFFPNVEDVRAKPDVSRWLASKDVYELLTNYTQCSEAWQIAISFIAAQGAKEKSDGRE